MPIPARQSHMQDVHYLRASLTLADLVAGGTGGVQIGTLPNGARVLNTHAFVTQAFNAATTNVMDVQDTVTAGRFLPTATILAGATGQKSASPAALGGVVAADTPVVVIYSQTGAAATTGAVDIVMTYAPNN